MTAHTLTSLQRCPREPLIERQRPGERPWYPKILYERVLHAAINRMSRGGKKHEIVMDAIEYFTSQAARPGLVTAFQPYIIAQDWIATIKTSLEWMARQNYGILTLAPMVVVEPGLEWTPNSLLGDNGVLHRFIAINSLSDNNRTRQHLRSWDVVGDTCALASPMHIHFIECGTARSGHQHSNWSRIYKHPSILGRYAFQSQEGRPLKGEWKPMWFADSDRNDPTNWVEMMDRDRCTMVRTVHVKAPDEYRRAEFARHLKYESERLKNLPAWEDLPPYRPACDVPSPCPFQYICFAPR